MLITPLSKPLTAALAVALALAAAGCGSRSEPASAASAATSATSAPLGQSATSVPGRETPLPAESNPPGDISDSQAFVKYVSRDGYSLDTPEGWAASTRSSRTSFVDKFDGLSVTVAAKPDTLASIAAAARAGRDFKERSVSLPAGKVVEISYTSNSEPDPVTEKRLRLENVAIIVSKGSKSATLRLWAPLGADNVDQWNRIERSFRLN